MRVRNRTSKKFHEKVSLKAAEEVSAEGGNSIHTLELVQGWELVYFYLAVSSNDPSLKKTVGLKH